MAGPQIKATLDWLAPTKDSGGAYFISDKNSIEELHRVWTAENLEKGQTVLPGMEGKP